MVTAAGPASTPLTHAKVAIEWTGGRADAVLTDVQGRFETVVRNGVPLTVQVDKAGYASQTVRIGSTGAGGDVMVPMPRGAVVTGVVLDERGVPAAGVTLQVRPSGPGGASSSMRTSETDDRGEFRVGSLAAGRYEVALVPSAAMPENPAFVSSATEARLEFRGNAQGAGAQAGVLVQLAAGEERALQLTFAPAVTRFRRIPVTDDSNGVVLEGRVTGPQGEPMPGAAVRARASSGVILAATADDNGSYRLGSLPAGPLRVSAVKSGYLSTNYGAARAGGPGKVVVARANQRLTGINVALVRAGIIGGQVTDDAGEPLEGLTVQVWRSVFRDGRRVVSPSDVRSRTTDDRGQYRLYGVTPGTYYLVVTATGLDGITAQHIVQADAASGRGGLAGITTMVMLTDSGAPPGAAVRGSPAASPVFYPGRTRIAEAQPLQVEASHELLGADITFAPGLLSRVHGRILDAQGQPYQGQVTLTMASTAAVTVGQSRTATAVDGNFQFEGVAPGDYIVRASTGPLAISTAAAGGGLFVVSGRSTLTGPSQFGLATVTVGEGVLDVGPLALQMAPAASVSGRVVVDGDSGTPPPAFVLRALAFDPDRSPGDTLSSTQVRPGGEFTIPNLSGPARFAVEGGLPAGWWLKAVNVDGVNAADDPVTFGSSPRTGAEVVLSHRSAELTAQVSGEGTAGVDVLVYSTEAERLYDRSRYLARQTSDAEGRAKFSGLPPGDYWAVAVESLPDDLPGTSWWNPEFLSALASSARRVTLTEGGKATAAVRLAPGPR